MGCSHKSSYASESILGVANTKQQPELTTGCHVAMHVSCVTKKWRSHENSIGRMQIAHRGENVRGW